MIRRGASRDVALAGVRATTGEDALTMGRAPVCRTWVQSARDASVAAKADIRFRGTTAVDAPALRITWTFALTAICTAVTMAIFKQLHASLWFVAS